MLKTCESCLYDRGSRTWLWRISAEGFFSSVLVMTIGSTLQTCRSFIFLYHSHLFLD